MHPVWIILQGLCLLLMNSSFWRSHFFADMLCWQMHKSNCSLLTGWLMSSMQTIHLERISLLSLRRCCLTKRCLFLLWRLFYWCAFAMSSRWTGSHIWTCVKGNLFMRDLAIFLIIFEFESMLLTCLHTKQRNWTEWIERCMVGSTRWEKKVVE